MLAYGFVQMETLSEKNGDPLAQKDKGIELSLTVSVMRCWSERVPRLALIFVAIAAPIEAYVTAIHLGARPHLGHEIHMISVPNDGADNTTQIRYEEVVRQTTQWPKMVCTPDIFVRIKS
jgi:hypothetical protein